MSNWVRTEPGVAYNVIQVKSNQDVPDELKSRILVDSNIQIMNYNGKLNYQIVPIDSFLFIDNDVISYIPFGERFLFRHENSIFMRVILVKIEKVNSHYLPKFIQGCNIEKEIEKTESGWLMPVDYWNGNVHHLKNLVLDEEDYWVQFNPGDFGYINKTSQHFFRLCKRDYTEIGSLSDIHL